MLNTELFHAIYSLADRNTTNDFIKIGAKTLLIETVDYPRHYVINIFREDEPSSVLWISLCKQTNEFTIIRTRNGHKLPSPPVRKTLKLVFRLAEKYVNK